MVFEILLSALLLAAPSHHAAPAAPAATGTMKQDSSAELPAPSVTRHMVKIGGASLAYTATAGFLPVLNDGGETEAQVFYISYAADSPDPGRKRPLIFFLNGGPGAASVWLHLGAAGPRRVKMLDDGRLPPSPYRLVDNDSSWLDLGDLVFIDPVGTGYSRAAKPESAQKFSTQQGDIDSLGRFIRLYLTRSGRWGSPLFLAGESYGAFRSAGLTEYLVEHGIALNGLLLISSVMNFQTISFNSGNDLPYQLFLPSYTATAWYHGRLSPGFQADLEQTLAAAEQWSDTVYLTSLARGDRLTPEERQNVARGISSFTGLDQAFIENRNLRIDSRTFVRELLRDRRQVVGFMDSRFTADNPDPSAPHGFDPAVATIRPPYTATFNDYVRNDLGFRSDLEYFTLGGGIGRWEYDARNSYADTSDNLRDAMAKNRYLRVFVASGLFDLATPHAATDYTLNHLRLPAELRKNVVTRRYRAGHMMYLESGSRAGLKKDVAEFIAGSLQ